MTALKEVSKVWLVARMVHTLFESILGNKVLEERLQKATGRKVQRTGRNGSKDQSSTYSNGHGSNGSMGQPQLPIQGPPPPPPMNNNNNKRKFDEIDLGFSVGPPAPQVSYERSRPQTPSVTPSREIGHQNGNGHTNGFASPPPPQNHEQLMTFTKSRGPSRIGSRMGTRANSPYNGFSREGTPPDLFLVTKNSPPISQALWETFQPDQLFPDGSIDTANLMSPTLAHPAVDPALQMSDPVPGQHGSPPMGAPHMNGPGQSTVWPPGMTGMLGAGMEMHDSDGWSNSSLGNAPVVPTTLNVEDWFQFFGIQGDMGAIGMEPQ